MTRVLTLYQGADMDPSWDYSDWVEWPDCDFSARAFDGQATQSEIRIRDVRGEAGDAADLPGGLTARGISAHNIFTLTENASGSTKHLWRGGVIPKDYSRGAQKADRAREVRVSVDDHHWELRGIIVGRDAVWSRPAETDVERVEAARAAYLQGDPRAATVIGNAYVAAGNTVNLPAKDYADTTVDEVLQDCATAADKRYWFVLNDDGSRDLFYDIHTSSAYASTLQIRQTGDPDEVDGWTTFDPVWDIGPASREDGQELLCGLKLNGPNGISGYAHDDTIHTDHNHYEAVAYDDGLVSQAEADSKAAAILNVRKLEQKTYSCSIYVPAERVHLIREGMNITIQAKVIPDADDQVVTRRIAQLRRKVYNNDLYKVELQLDKPTRIGPYGSGDRAAVIAKTTTPTYDCIPSETLVSDYDTIATAPGAVNWSGFWAGALGGPTWSSDTSQVTGGWDEKTSGGAGASWPSGGQVRREFCGITKPSGATHARLTGNLIWLASGDNAIGTDMDYEIYVSSWGVANTGSPPVFAWSLGLIETGTVPSPATLLDVSSVPISILWSLDGLSAAQWVIECPTTPPDGTGTRTSGVNLEGWTLEFLTLVECDAPLPTQHVENYPLGNGDGVTTEFTLPGAFQGGSLLVWVDGLLQQPDSIDAAAGTFDLGWAPAADEVVTASWIGA